MDVEIITGDAACSLLEQPAFEAQWRELAARDPKFTLYQEPPFVRAWLAAYGDLHEPWVVRATGGDGALLGFLPLARDRERGGLRHVGGDQAEYHGWIAEPAHDAEFVVEAILALRSAAGFASWKWRWCPPGTSAAALASRRLVQAGIHVATEVRPSPVLELGDPERLRKVLASRSLRAKVNRYRRREGYRFERIEDPERTSELLPILAQQCDFRQEVVNGVRPFADDPRKAAFFVRRQDEPQASHFTVLWAGEEPVAFHFGGCDGTTCLLGLSAYAPPESPNSPGMVLIAELARSLAEEGYERLDLTPGSDPYKQRFATSHTDLVRLTLHGSRLHSSRARAWAVSRRALDRVLARQPLGVQDRIARVQRGVRRAIRSGRREGPGATLRAARRAIGDRRSWECLVRPPEPALEPPRRDDVRVQDYASLAERPPAPYFSSREERLSDALARFSEGQVVYEHTAQAGESLLGWRAPRPDAQLVEVLSLEEPFELLSGFEGLTEGAGFAERFAPFLSRMVADVPRAHPLQAVLLVPPRAHGAQQVAASLGFGPCGRVTRSEAAGRVRWRFVRRAGAVGEGR